MALLVPHRPRGQGMGHHPPRCTCSDDPAKPLKTSHRLCARWGGVFSPFPITDITGICFARHCLASLRDGGLPYCQCSIVKMKVHDTLLLLEGNEV